MCNVSGPSDSLDTASTRPYDLVSLPPQACTDISRLVLSCPRQRGGFVDSVGRLGLMVDGVNGLGISIVLRLRRPC